MAKSPAHSISDFLVANNQGVYSEAPPVGTYRVGTGREGDKPNQFITVYDSGGSGQPDNPRWRINYPMIQVRVRGNKDDYTGTWSKINDLKELLVGLEPQDIDGDRWSGIIINGGINFIGYDSVSRPMFTVNLKCFVEPAADSSPNMHRESL
jgi:hypothetical protein